MFGISLACKINGTLELKPVSPVIASSFLEFDNIYVENIGFEPVLPLNSNCIDILRVVEFSGC